MSACVGPRPPASPLSSAMASSSAVTRQPAFLSCERSSLEGRAIFLLQRREPFQHLGCKGRAGIGCGFLDQSFQRIGDILGRVDGVTAIRFSDSFVWSPFIARSPRCGARGPSARR